ncbi:probable F-box protein At4g22030 [Vitis vinifera]|nr:probable F-box protein At4g22030 [Vitis vinifera]|eukprot:XP_003632954.1 PREDICTED: probable F-box protein At4g22030 [Vitis vinifera]
MASLQSSSVTGSVAYSSSRCRRGMIRATINMPKLRTSGISLKLPTRDLVQEVLDMGVGLTAATTGHVEKKYESITDTTFPSVSNVSDPMVIAKLHAIMEAVADRVEMHKNIGEQRDNWNHLLLTSINAITLTAATMAGIAATSVGGPLVALKLSSTLMYLAATGMLVVMNKIQPSQLVEEQRNAVRLFKQLHGQIQRTLSCGTPTSTDVEEAMEKVLALDKAYPLPLLGAMLDKFPKTVEPAVWWPQNKQRQRHSGRTDGNGWSMELEEEMREVVGVLKRKDTEDYLRLGKIALKVNKILAISGPLLTGLAACGTAFVGSSHGPWAATLGVVAGAMASVVNTMEHGGQVGMVFEMYRSTAGFFRLMEETIESNLSERDVGRRENGELFEMKVALQLGRSLSGLKDLAASSYSSSKNGDAIEEFASKLF